MARRNLSRSWIAGAAVLAAAALGACDGGAGPDPAVHTIAIGPRTRDDRDREADAGRSARAALRDDPTRDGGSPDASVTVRTIDAPDVTTGEAPSDAAPAPPSGADPFLYSVVRSPGIDLEFTSGLPEPPQDRVLPPPAPWTPDPSAGGAASPVIEDVAPDAGPASGGSRVVIRGRSLQALQVVFGVAPAQIVSQSDDEVTVVAPAAKAGPATIVVTNRDGSYAIASRTFHYAP